MNVAIAVFLGGGLGSLSRYGVSKIVELIWKGEFPLGTLIANLLSCVVMGVFLSLLSDKVNNQALRAFILIGFCGGFSTFSTFSKETLELMQNGSYLIAVGNVLVSLLFCLFILWVFTSRSV